MVDWNSVDTTDIPKLSCYTRWQRVGIGTIDPLEKLHVVGQGAVRTGPKCRPMDGVIINGTSLEVLN